jgi:preprotein translocase subunit YajC
MVFEWCIALIPFVHHSNSLYIPIIKKQARERRQERERRNTLEVGYRTQREREKVRSKK